MGVSAPSKESSPRAVLWDIGNVIVRWNPRTLYARIFPDPEECDRFLAEVCTMAWHLETDRGLSFAENGRILIARHPHYEDQILAWEHRWGEMFSGAIAETEAVIETLAARGVQQFGLTNMSVETYDQTIALSPAFRHLRDIVVSGAEGVIKPDPEIYRRACARLGLPPSAILFVDDSERNIAAADALGFHTHHFTDPAGLAPALAAHGLL